MSSYKMFKNLQLILCFMDENRREIYLHLYLLVSHQGMSLKPGPNKKTQKVL